MLRNDTLTPRNLTLTPELHDYLLDQGRMTPDPLLAEVIERKIGRASCRERV